jgi:hypothetical protein
VAARRKRAPVIQVIEPGGIEGDYSIVFDPRLAQFRHRIDAHALQVLAAGFIAQRGAPFEIGATALWLENNDLIILRNAGSA